ncbi:MAG: hypothetical protein JXA45_06530 [Methanomassiliicoccales archaeon]|nr:hypothetical protein [Methanomassiliicoccales archaeon]
MDKRGLSRWVKGWAIVSFLLLLVSLVTVFQGTFRIDLNGEPIGLGQVLWLPALIGSCGSLWLLLTLSGTRTVVSISVALTALVGAEGCALLLPVSPIHGLFWEAGNALVPAISFASLALTALTWTATLLVDPPRRSWWTYGVALTAIVLMGFLLSYEYFYYLQGVMATSLAGALVWGSVLDRRLHRYSREGMEGKGATTAAFIATYLALPLLIIGMPYLLQ